MSLPIVILAGGLAKRMSPLTDSLPKSLLQIAGQPFITHQLHYLHAQGIRRVVLCVGHLGDRIQALVGDGSGFGLDVVYSFDGPSLLGTGGAIKKALPLLGSPFFVLYGDSFLPINFSLVEQAFFAKNKPALMTVLHNNNHWDTSNVQFEAGELKEYNKQSPRPGMHYIDYGLAVVTKEVFDNYHEGVSFDLADMYHSLSIKGQLAGLEEHERFYEIGSHGGLMDTELYFLGKKSYELHRPAFARNNGNN